MAKRSNPERCKLHCKNMQKWLADPEGFSETEGGWLPNARIAEKAARICPGVSVSLLREDPTKIIINADGTATLAANALEFYCQFFTADHGLDMGS